MSVQSIYNPNTTTTANVNTTSKAVEKPAKEVPSTAVENTKGFDETAVIYEKSQPEENYVKLKNNNGIDREAIIAQMKADTEARMNQLTDIVKQMISGQGNSFAIASENDVWSFLASGDYTVTEAAKLQAQEDISENGYWGVEQTSERILDFAKALAGNDASKADELFDAFKEGYKQATGVWGKDLPEISKQTYDAVEEKFKAWKAETQQITATENAVEQASEAAVVQA